MKKVVQFFCVFRYFYFYSFLSFIILSTTISKQYSSCYGSIKDLPRRLLLRNSGRQNDKKKYVATLLLWSWQATVASLKNNTNLPFAS